MTTPTRGHRLEATNIPKTLFRRAIKEAKKNNQTKTALIIAALDLYCDVQEGKVSVRRAKK